MRDRYHPAIVFRGERPRPATPPPVPRDALAALSADARRRMPNLIGIGAGKCGTSALHAYLADHPDIAMSARKELQLFGGARWLERLEWYASCFDPDAAVRGEVSPTYTMDPFIPQVPEQIAAVAPDARFIYLVGEPVGRALAHWREQRSLTLERRGLSEAFADASNPLNPYMAGSRFGHQLERFQAVFGPGRVLVVEQDDLRERRRETLRAVYAFAGVDPDHWSPACDAEPNAAADKVQPNRLGRWVLDRTRASSAGKRLATVRPVTAGRIPAVAFDDATRARVEAALAPDVARLRELTGRPFARWSL